MNHSTRPFPRAHHRSSSFARERASSPRFESPRRARGGAAVEGLTARAFARVIRPLESNLARAEANETTTTIVRTRVSARGGHRARRGDGEDARARARRPREERANRARHGERHGRAARADQHEERGEREEAGRGVFERDVHAVDVLQDE